MRKFLVVAVAVAALGVAAPASGQVFLGADGSGAGVQLGPLGIGVGPRFSDDDYRHRRGYRYGHRRGYNANAEYVDCRVIRTRVVRNGKVKYRTRRVCR
jgi:hypothetical protein